MPARQKNKTNSSLDRALVRFRENVSAEKLNLFMQEDSRLEALSAAMVDTAYASIPFPQLCKKFGITLQELQTLYTDGMRHLALLELSNGLPLISHDVIEDAKSRDVVCPRCDGMKELVVVTQTEDGELREQRDCPVCDATGTVRTIGDKHARDLIFESMKLTGGKGPMVAIQQNFNAAPADDRVETLLKMTQQITMGEVKKDDQ